MLVRAGGPPLSPTERTSRRTTQEVEFADDLWTGALGDTPREFRIWPAPDSEIKAELTLAEPADASLELVTPDGNDCPATSKFDGQRGTWKAASSGWHTFRLRLVGGKSTPGYLKLDYEGE